MFIYMHIHIDSVDEYVRLYCNIIYVVVEFSICDNLVCIPPDPINNVCSLPDCQISGYILRIVQYK